MSSTASVALTPQGEGKITLPPTRVKLAETVGERIKWARERKELTQKELAKLAGKSRASIVQYEQDKIAAPLAVIEELADRLGVSPEFLAFGRSGISGVRNAEEEVQIMEELSGPGSSLVAAGGWAVPRSMFADYGQTGRGDLKIVCLGTDEPSFDMERGDRVVVDTKAAVAKDGLYVVQTPFGARVVRISLGYAAKSGVRIVSGTDGGEEMIDPQHLDLVGAVIGIFRRTF